MSPKVGASRRLDAAARCCKLAEAASAAPNSGEESMKTSRRFPTAALALALALAALSAAFVRTPSASAQQYGPLERGYRTGYSDGYQSGWVDQLKSTRADYKAKADYRSADRAYISAYGA